MSDTLQPSVKTSGQPCGNKEGNSTQVIDSTPTTWKRPTPVTTIDESTLGRLSELMLLDCQCSVLVHKRSLQNLPLKKTHQLFTKHMKTIGAKRLCPYFRDDGVDIFYLHKNDVYLVGARSSPQADTAITPVVTLDFLQRVYNILKECLGSVNEAHVSVNRMLVFELLDEIMCLGYCFTSTYAEIRPHLTFEPVRPKRPEQSQIASKIFGINAADKSRTQTSSNKAGNKAVNSAYINIVEGLSAVLGYDGQIRSCELSGKLTLISTLERPAPIVIQLNEDLVIRASGQKTPQVGGATHIENPNFHSCVDTSQLEKHRVLKLLPPPDQTRLLMYTLSDASCIRVPILLLPSLTPIDGSRDRDLTLRLINQAESRAVASYVKVNVKLPEWIQSISTTKTNEDHLSCFKAEDKSAKWEMKKCRGGTEECIRFRLICPSDKSISLSDLGPISVAFNLTHFSASGLVVRMARVETSDRQTQSTPECFFGVSTKSDSYTVRTDVLST